LKITKNKNEQSEIKNSLEGLRSKWDKRLEWVPPDAELWRQILTLRSLVLKPEEDLDAWLKYEKLCRRSGKLSLCHSALKRLGVEDLLEKYDPHFIRSITSSISRMAPGVSGLNEDGEDEDDIIDRTSLMGMNPMYSPLQKLRKFVKTGLASGGSSALVNNTVNVTKSKHVVGANSRVMYSIFKYMWACGHKKDALEGLEHYCLDLNAKYENNLLIAHHGSRSSSMASNVIKATNSAVTSNRKLLGRCMLKVGKWKILMAEGERGEGVNFDEIIKLQRDAAEIRPNYYKVSERAKYILEQHTFLELQITFFYLNSLGAGVAQLGAHELSNDEPV